MKINVKDDLYDIAWRIKAIDPDYEIKFDTVLKRYEVYARGKLQSVLPFDRLDARTVTYLSETRVERIDKIMSEIDAFNEKKTIAREKSLKDEIAYKSGSVFRYYSKHENAAPVKYEEI